MRFRYTVSLMLIFSGFIYSALAQRTIHMNVEELIKHSGVIVHGTVIKVESGYDSVSRLTATRVTINVIENYFGAPANEYTFKQYGGKIGKRNIKLPDMPQYRIGEELILMLTPPSRIGLQSPVGMHQGKFKILKNKESGRNIAVNGKNNVRLFEGIKSKGIETKLKKVSVKESEITTVQFSEIIRSLVKTLKTENTK